MDSSPLVVLDVLPELDDEVIQAKDDDGPDTPPTKGKDRVNLRVSMLVHLIHVRLLRWWWRLCREWVGLWHHGTKCAGMQNDRANRAPWFCKQACLSYFVVIGHYI
jgi:hypothetical protein